MPIPVLVPDASVLLKWALQSSEEGRDLALALKDAWLGGRCRLVVPSLWIFEVGNILGLKQPDRSGALLQAMVDLELEQTGPTAYLDQIFRFMSDYKVTFYDAAYHGLAVFPRRYADHGGREIREKDVPGRSCDPPGSLAHES